MTAAERRAPREPVNEPVRPGRLRRALVAALLVSWGALLATLPAEGAGRLHLTPAYLEAQGVDLRLFALVALSRDGSVLVAMERTKDAALRQRGCTHVLRVFHFAGGRKVKMDTIPVPIAGLQQVALSEDGSRALTIGESGCKFALVDLVGRRTTVLWQQRRGTPGFRAEPVVAWWGAGGFYLLGCHVNEKDRATFEGVVRLNPGRGDARMFEPLLELRAVRGGLGSILFETVVSEAEAYFGVVQKPGQIEICEYRTGRVRRLDQVRSVGGVASAPNRLLYAARFDNGSADVVLVDGPSGRTWRLGRENLPFSYLFLSHNGRTVILTLIDFRAKTMSYYYALEGEGFRVRPLKALQGIHPGTLRLSGDGRTFAFFGNDGLVCGPIP